jgi:hypothetical protein
VSEFTLDDAGDADDIPLVPTELIGAAPAAAPQQVAEEPFEDFRDYFATDTEPEAKAPSSGISVRGGTSALSALSEMPIEVPMSSIEIPLPDGILDSLPDLSAPSSSRTATAPDRRANDGLVKEVTVPLNLTMDELRQHRRLRLKITLDVNLLS